jgi:tRNA-specific 2-thiouridylase
VDVADARPRYVLGIEPVSRTVTVGTAEQAGVGTVRTAAPTWTGARPELPLRAEVQLRAHGAPVPCEVTADGTGLLLALAVEQRGVAPGQSAVLYEPDPVRGDRVLGQGAVLSAA